MYRLQGFILFMLLSMIGCTTEPSNLDSEVHIIKVNKYSEKANVQYQVENIGAKPIRGWHIYFRVSMKSSKQVKAHHGLTYSLEPGEISAKLVATGEIPDHFDDVDVPTTAALQLIEVY